MVAYRPHLFGCESGRGKLPAALPGNPAEGVVEIIVPPARCGLLDAARTLTDPALRAAVGGLSAPMSRIASYHFGWCDAGGLPAEGESGKSVRSALVLGCAEAVGGEPCGAVPAAVAAELVHNASLLHDDIIDGDTTRRNRPTAWTVFGLPAAILAGDALFFLAVQVLTEQPPRRSGGEIRHLTATVQRLIDGEHADTTFENRSRVSLPECLAMAVAKTGALLECACTLGAIYGGATAGQTRALGQFGAHLGIAFQLIDDLLGIWGDPDVTGKPAASDLINRKKTVPVVVAMTSGTAAGQRLAAMYHGAQPLNTEAVARAAILIEQAGGRARTQELAEHHVRAALELLGAARPAQAPAAELTELAHLITNRDH
jgi:geranylgeranyl diphosphate synthase, type I